MEDEDIVPDMYSWFSRYGQKVVPVGTLYWIIVYWRDFLPVPTESDVFRFGAIASSYSLRAYSFYGDSIWNIQCQEILLIFFLHKT